MREPLGQGPGWWAGAPSSLFDPDTGRIYLYYRYRKPRELGRGAECRIAVSSDGLHFDDVWTCDKSQLDSPSVEKAALCITPSGKRRLYISYVDPSDNRWRIDMMEAASFEELDPAERRPALTASDVGGEGVKDPFVMNIGGLYWMLASYAPSPDTPQSREAMHSTADVYNTGLVKSSTGYAISADGLEWEWQGDIFSPSEKGWDAYCARLGSVILEPPLFVGFYDGSASVEENYEEKAGLAVSFDLAKWHRLTPKGPFVTSPYSSHSIRYVDALKLPDQYFFYYEYARPDGSHELRMNLVSYRDEEEAREDD